MCALYKDNLLPNKLESLGNKIGESNKIGWFLLELSICKFCMNTWGALLVATSCTMYEMDYNYMILGFIFPSIEAFIKR